MPEINLKFITKRRNELKISLQEMAIELGYKNASTYMKYEKGEYKFEANHVPILAAKLGCKIDELFFNNNFAKTTK